MMAFTSRFMKWLVCPAPSYDLIADEDIYTGDGSGLSIFGKYRLEEREASAWHGAGTPRRNMWSSPMPGETVEVTEAVHRPL